MFILDQHPSIANQFLSELRDEAVQGDRMRFRKNAERLGEIMAYELSRTFRYNEREVTTPLGKKIIQLYDEQPVLITILRAGLPFFQGFLNFFDKADCGFIGAFRKEGEDNITIKLEYAATPSLNNRIVILIDPMLATGRSVLDSVNAILKNGTPSILHLVSLVAAPEGVRFLGEHLKLPYKIWTCAMDEKLNSQFYIVPGLGDAGDLSYGMKL